MKKLVSMLLVLAMLVTVFAGLAITASAADAALTVYTQAGADGEKTLAKSYTAEELKKLAEQYQMELDKVKAAVDTAAVKSDLMGKKAAKIITDNAVAVAPTEEKKDDAETSEKE